LANRTDLSKRVPLRLHYRRTRYSFTRPAQGRQSTALKVGAWKARSNFPLQRMRSLADFRAVRGFRCGRSAPLSGMALDRGVMARMTTDNLPADVAWAVAYFALENSK